MDTSTNHERVWEAVPAGLTPPALELRARFLLARAHAATAREGGAPRVLDVGCGEAQLTYELARAGFRVIGVDVAEEPLRRARARHPDLDLRVVPENGEWQFGDSEFDLVWAGEVIEHVTGTLALFSEIRRVLRSGGTLALSTPAHSRLSLLALALSRDPFGSHFDPRSDHVRFYSRGSLRGLLGELGFEDVHVRARGHAPRLLLASARRTRFIA